MTTEITKIAMVGPNKIVEVHSTTSIEAGGEVYKKRTFMSYPPGSNMTDAPEAAKALAALWTQADIDAYRALGQPEDA